LVMVIMALGLAGSDTTRLPLHVAAGFLNRR